MAITKKKISEQRFLNYVFFIKKNLVTLLNKKND